MILGREWADGDFYLFGGDYSSLLRAFSYCFVAAVLCLRAINENVFKIQKRKVLILQNNKLLKK